MSFRTRTRILVLALSVCAGTVSPRADAKASGAFRFAPPALTGTDSLFIVAATGEPRFRSQRDSAEKRLVAGDTATLDYLVGNRLAKQTPRQRHYVERLFKLISDSGRNHAPVTRLASALYGAPDSVKVQLLRIGSELGDSTFLPVARLYLRADSAEVRKIAVRSLGAYPAAANAAQLMDGLEKTGDLERQSRLWALERQAEIKDWPLLLPMLKDENLYNRQLVRRIVAKATRGDWMQLRKHAPDSTTGEADLEWILLALDVPGPDAKAYVRKNTALLDPAERQFIESMFSRRPKFR